MQGNIKQDLSKSKEFLNFTQNESISINSERLLQNKVESYFQNNNVYNNQINYNEKDVSDIEKANYQSVSKDSKQTILCNNQVKQQSIEHEESSSNNI